jgi:hypothetical protein
MSEAFFFKFLHLIHYKYSISVHFMLLAQIISVKPDEKFALQVPKVFLALSEGLPKKKSIL